MSKIADMAWVQHVVAHLAEHAGSIYPRMDALAADLAGHIRDGIFHPPEIRVMPLAEAAEAHRIGDTGHVRGKIVFEI